MAIAVLFSAASILAGCKKEAKSADTSLADVKAKGFFILGLDDSFPPMGFRDEAGNIVGFDIDMAKAAAKKIGVELKIQPVDWDGVILSLDKGDIDLIWNGMTITEERKEKIIFSKPYLANTQAIAVLSGSAIASKADLAGKAVGVQLGSPSEDAIAADAEVGGKTGEIRKYGKYPEALLDLSAGRIDAVVGDAILIRYYLSKKPGEYKVLADHFGAEEYGIGFRKADSSFRDAIDAAIDEMRKDGTAAEISKTWFGDNIVLQ
ncbi:MAG: amino acid ABC transporter substrate-binding protein [Spirochaetales bacterium]|nr:amino acid ABC transporter substrate-binding protein [Spirochaetales bacterium]